MDEETEPSSEGEELPGMDEYLSDRVVFTNSYPLPFSVKVEWEIDSEQRWKPGSVTLVLQHKVKVQENAEQTQGQEQQDAQGTQEQEEQTKWETVQTAVVSDVNKWETSFLVFLPMVYLVHCVEHQYLSTTMTLKRLRTSSAILLILQQ